MRVGTFVLAAQFPGQGQGEALHRAIRSAEATETAGLDAVWLAEHHFVPYGVCPSAVTLAGLLLGRTERIGVGTAVSVLPTAHPVALGEQAALLHLASGGRFTLGRGPRRALGRPGGLRRRGCAAFERASPSRSTCCCAGCASPRSARTGRGTPSARCRWCRAPTSWTRPVPGPPVVVACTSPGTVRLAARRGLPMLLGMHCGDEEKAADGRAVAARPPWRRGTRRSGRGGGRACVRGRGADRRHPGRRRGDPAQGDARLAAARPGRAPHRGRQRAHDARSRTPTPNCCAPCTRWARRGCAPTGSPATAERTGITRFALLAEGSGDLAATLENVARLGGDVLPELA